MSLCEKVVVVTGASAGVGRAVVREFATRGRSWDFSHVVRSDWVRPRTKRNGSEGVRWLFRPMSRMPMRSSRLPDRLSERSGQLTFG